MAKKFFMATNLILEKGKDFSVYAGKEGHAGKLYPRDIEKLSKDLSKIKALMVESNALTMAVFSRVNPNCVEAICWRESEGKPRGYLLEQWKDGAKNHEELFKEYHISFDTAAKMLAGYLFFSAPPKTSDMKVIGQNLYNGVDQLFSLAYPFLDPKQATDAFFEQAHRCPEMESVNQFRSATATFTEYMGKLREYEYWRQELLDFRQRYDKIGVCVGAFHVPFVKQLLSGSAVEKPGTLEEYADRKNPESKKFF